MCPHPQSAAPSLQIRRRHVLGFTLIEVVVALAIFSLAVGVLSQAIGNAIRGLEAVQNDSDREQLYRFALRQILRVESRDEVERGGDFTAPDGGTITWQADIQETQVLDLFLLSVSVTLPEQDRRNVSSNTAGRTESVYVYRPNWSESIDRSSLLTEKKDALLNERLRNP